MKIVFIEGLGAKPYTIKDLSGSVGLGGTETSMLRISRELAPRHKIILFQSGRKQRKTDVNGVEYWPLEDVAKVEDADVLIILRLPRLLKLHKHFPGARYFSGCMTIGQPGQNGNYGRFTNGECTLLAQP